MTPNMFSKVEAIQAQNTLCNANLEALVHQYGHPLVEIFKYMTKFNISIPVIKDICEVVNDSLVIV
jgi:hypothetical protein